MPPSGLHSAAVCLLGRLLNSSDIGLRPHIAGSYNVATQMYIFILSASLHEMFANGGKIVGQSDSVRINLQIYDPPEFMLFQ